MTTEQPNYTDDGAQDAIFARLSKIEDALQAITDRNQRVETDKAWEVSKLRICFIASMTYVVAVTVFFLMQVSNPYSSAIVPVLGYYLSTSSLPFLKSWWVAKTRR